MEQEADASRRVLIKGVVLFGLAGAAGVPLAGCGGGGEPAAAGPATPPDPVAPPPSTAASAASPRPTRTRKPAKGGASRAEPTSTATSSSKRPSRKPKPSATTAAPLVPKGPPIADAADIPVGSGALFEFDELIVTQPTAGDFRGFHSLCPHEGCVIDVFEGDQMICACHNSYFRIADGSKVRGPARTAVPTRAIVVVEGKIHRA